MINKGYLIKIEGNFSTTIIDAREISHITTNFAINNKKSEVHTKSGGVISVVDVDSLLRELNRVIEIDNQVKD